MQTFTARGETTSQLEEAIKSFNSKRYAEAIRQLSGILSSDPEHKAALAYTGLAEFHLGNPERGITLLKRVVELYPEDPLGHEFLGMATNHLARFDESITAFSETARLKPTSSDAQWNLGVTLMSVGEQRRAEEAFRKALAIDPYNMALYSALGNALADMGDFESCFEVFEKGLGIQPYNIDLLMQYANALINNGECEDGFNLLKDALRMFPDHPRILRTSAFANLNSGSAQNALECFEKLIPGEPDDETVFEGYVYSVLKNREPDRALRIVNDYLASHRHSTRTLALETLIHHELGNDEKALDVLGFDSLFHTADVRDREPRLSGTDAFTEISLELSRHPTLIESPRTHATQNGFHSGELFRHAGATLNILKQQIEQQVAAYIDMARRRLDPQHPFVANTPRSYRIYAWTIVMKNQGYQKQHIHPSGWLSGVTYIQLPDAVYASAAAREGWIEFGQPPEGFPWQREPQLHSVQPEIGKIVLFPSYYYHKTIPFTADRQRISVAFDVIPTSC